MKYFKKELWDKINSVSFEEKQLAIKQWEENLKIYWKKFEQIRGRISKSAFDIMKNSFHDCRLCNLQLNHAPFGQLEPIQVIITVTDGENFWQIKYKGIQKIKLDFEQGTSSFEKRRGFDTWGYDELLTFDDNLLSHEILFASGATLLVIFKNNGFSISKVKNIKQPYYKNSQK